MASINGEPVNLHKMDVDHFLLMDGTKVSPLHITLDAAEMDALSMSGTTDKLLTQYGPVFHPETKTITFKLRTNKGRHEYRQHLKKIQRERELSAVPLEKPVDKRLENQA